MSSVGSLSPAQGSLAVQCSRRQAASQPRRVAGWPTTEVTQRMVSICAGKPHSLKIQYVRWIWCRCESYVAAVEGATDKPVRESATESQNGPGLMPAQRKSSNRSMDVDGRGPPRREQAGAPMISRRCVPPLRGRSRVKRQTSKSSRCVCRRARIKH